MKSQQPSKVFTHSNQKEKPTIPAYDPDPKTRGFLPIPSKGEGVSAIDRVAVWKLCIMETRSTTDSKEKSTVSPSEYDESWIDETWGWDDAETFIRTGGSNIRPRVLKALEIAQLKKGMRVLDVGCGRGEAVLQCARKGIEAVGIDYSKPALELAERARHQQSEQVQSLSRFVLSDVKNFDTCSGYFDRIFLLDLVEHLHDWELVLMLRKLKSVLKVDGLIIIHTLPNRWIYEVTYGRILRTLMPWLQKNPRTSKEKVIHINEMSITHLDQLMQFCGYCCRVWLQEVLTAQASWHARMPPNGRRGRLYRWFANPMVAFLYKVLSKTPFRVLIVNDIFCIAWHEKNRIKVRPSRDWTERLLCNLGRNLYPWTFTESTRRSYDI
jgi:2-polyprenyl-3-methyl-5-hydroxy-6-metoxy-1,4-benzoquinol methylase